MSEDEMVKESAEDGEVGAPFGLTDKSSKEFKAVDPFNPQNEVEGLICMSEGSKLGNLIITKVNGRPCKQWIQCTPKIHYPFDNNDAFLIKPERTKKVIAYEKLDGTNILMFNYSDADGNNFISFKTRKMPFVGADFKYLWDTCLQRYPDLKGALKNNDKNISFELYGSMNKHGIIYDLDIDTKILFGRDYSGKLFPPSMLNVGNVGHPRIIKECDYDETADYRKIYTDMENWLTSQFVKDETEQKDGEEYEFSGRGMEGTVWYVLDDYGNWTLYKCKGEQVKEEHFKNASGVQPGHVNQALFKTMEAGMELTIENVMATLREDWPEEEVNQRFHMIKRMIEGYEADKKLRTVLYEAYDAQHALDPTFDINLSKNRTMQFFANKMKEWDMPKRYSAKVYTNLIRKYGTTKA